MNHQIFPDHEFEDDLWISKCPPGREQQPHRFHYLLAFPTLADALRFADRWRTRSERIDGPEHVGGTPAWQLRVRVQRVPALLELAQYEREMVEIAELSAGHLLGQHQEPVESVAASL